MSHITVTNFHTLVTCHNYTIIYHKKHYRRFWNNNVFRIKDSRLVFFSSSFLLQSLFYLFTGIFLSVFSFSLYLSITKWTTLLWDTGTLTILFFFSFLFLILYWFSFSFSFIFILDNEEACDTTVTWQVT